MRVELGPVEQTKTGKWTASFNIWNGQPGAEYLASTVSGGYGFDSEDLANAAGHRAMAYLAETDRFPNMCEAY